MLVCNPQGLGVHGPSGSCAPALGALGQDDGIGQFVRFGRAGRIFPRSRFFFPQPRVIFAPPFFAQAPFIVPVPVPVPAAPVACAPRQPACAGSWVVTRRVDTAGREWDELCCQPAPTFFPQPFFPTVVQEPVFFPRPIFVPRPAPPRPPAPPPPMMGY